MIPKERTYPVFEPNQVLTNHHLNDLFEYLDEQNRLTRSNLIGIGIVCGLELSVADDSSSITITRGCGVTSEGYLAVVPNDPTPPVPDSVTFHQQKVYTLPEEVAYPPFSPSGQQVDLWELFPDDEPGALPLDAAFLQDKVLLLFVECNLANLKTCSPNSCDDKGQEVTVNLRKLLINRTDLDRIIEAAGDGLAGGFSLNAQLNLPDLRLRRFDVQNTGVDNAMEIFTAYQKILFEAQNGWPNLFVAMEKALSEAWQVFLPVVGSVAPDDPFAGKLTALQGRFTTNYFNSNIIVTQYFYDYMADLIAAYEEFRKRAMEWWALCCPPSGLFPRHLMLGELQGTGVAGQKVYRHYFRPSPAQAQQATLGAAVRTLFQRLVLMVENLALPLAPFRGTVPSLLRITPSKLGPFELSEKAIPYYYRVNTGEPPLYKLWSYEKLKMGRPAHNLSYHSDKYPAPPFVQKALEYDHEPNNFYRIEGHIGKPWRDVVKELLNRTTRYRLPFDVLALNADQFAVTRDPQPGRCMDNDLNVIYKIWMNEASCLFKKKIGFFSSFDIANNRFMKYTAKTSANTAGGGRSPRGPGLAATAMATASIADSGILLAGIGPLVSKIRIDDAVVGSAGSIGEVIKPNLPGSGGTVSAADLVVKANDALKDNEKIKTMTVQDYNVVVEQPVRLIGAFGELADAIPDDSEDLDIALISSKYNNLRLVADKYFGDLLTLPDDFVFLPPEEKKSALDELKSLLDNCLDKRLEELAAEIGKRKKAAAEAIWFSNYVKKHPDIQHKAGVPVGGTFILVFRETPNTPPPVTNPGLVRPTGLSAGAIADIANILVASEATAAANSKLNLLQVEEVEPTVRIPKRLTDNQTAILSDAFSAAGLTLDLGNLISEGLFEPSPDFAIINPRTPNVPEGVVIADFFVPYRCCSDCPPVQFVLPPPKPSFSAEVGCPGPNTASVTISIIAGERPFEIKIGTAEGAVYQPFDPAVPIELPVGTQHVLTIRDSQGGESMPVTVDVALPMVIDPGRIICNEAATAFNVSIFVLGGKAPFLVNGQPPIESVTEPTGTRLLAGPFPNGAHTLIITDANGCQSQPANVEMQCKPAPPVANPDVATTAFNTEVRIDVLANDSGTGLTVEIPTQTIEGSLVVNADRSLNFRPNASVSGRATSFSYQIRDSVDQTASTTVTVQVGSRPCDLPCGGIAERSRYPMWMTRPEAGVEVLVRQFESAQLLIRDEVGNERFNELLTEIFRAEFPGGSSLNSNNFNTKTKRLFAKINDLVASKLGPDVFVMENSEQASGGTLAVERFVCNGFLFDVRFTILINQFPVVARWTYSEEAVTVRQSEPSAPVYKVEKFGIDTIDKCANPRIVKQAERITINNIRLLPNRLGQVDAVTTPALNDGNARFDWILEFSKAPFLNGKVVSPDFASLGKARLIVVAKDGSWDYFEKRIGENINPNGPRTGDAPVPRPTTRPVVRPTNELRATPVTRGAAEPPAVAESRKKAGKKAAEQVKTAKSKMADKPKATKPKSTVTKGKTTKK